MTSKSVIYMQFMNFRKFNVTFGQSLVSEKVVKKKL